MKSLKHYLLVIAISFIPFVTIFLSPDLPHTHDGPVQVARIAAYYKALGDGQILPRWAGDLNYGYGMPLFNFMYHIPYLVGSFFVSLGFSLITSFKLVLLLSFLLSGIGMFAFVFAFTQDKKTAFVSMLLYQFSPFHLVDLVVRGSVGEVYTYSFLPFVLLFLYQSFHRPATLVSTGCIAFSCALLILSHNSVSLLFFGVCVTFVLFFAPTMKARIHAFWAMGIGLLLTAFYWIPALFERKYTYGDLFMKDMYKEHFVPFTHFFIPNLTNSKSLQVEGVAVDLGIIQSLVLLFSIVLLFYLSNKHPSRKIIFFSVLLSIPALLSMQSLTAPIWEKIKLLRMFQFPWRLLSVLVFTTAFLYVPLAKTYKIFLSPKWLIAVCCLIVISSVVYFRPPWGFDRVKESDFWNYPLNTTYFGETDVIWSAGPANAYPNKRFEIIEGDGYITNTHKGTTKHSFRVDAKSAVRVVDRTQYFPGWRVYANAQKVPIEFQDINWRGLITFSLPKGTHTVVVAFRESPTRQIAEMISLSTLILFLFFLLVPKTNPKIS